MRFSISIAVAALSILPAAVSALPAKGGRTLNFLGRVNIAVRNVQAKHPEALLQTVTGVSSTGQPVGESSDLEQLTLTFQSADGQLQVKSNGWSSFTEPQTLGPNLLGATSMNWPEDIDNMDLETADEQVRAFGDENKFKKVVLSLPVGNIRGKKQATYSFTTTNDVVLSVATKDGWIDVTGA